MQRLDGRLVLSPTDLTHHQECRHLTRLDLGVAAGEWAAPDVEVTEELQLVFDRGLDAREEVPRVAEGRRASRSREIETVFDAEGRRRAEAQTVEAMRRGVDVVYQGTFFDGAWGGQADFLLRVETPSRLRRLVVRDRRHQARPEAEGRRAAADGHVRRAAHGAAGGRAGAHPRRHRGRRLAAVAADRRRRVRPSRAGPAGDLRRRAAGDRTLADRLLRAVPLGRAVQHRAAAGRRPRPGRRHARRPPRRAAGGGHPDAGGAGDGVAGAAEVVRHRRRRAHPAAAAGGRAAQGADHRAGVAHAARPAARPRAAAPAAAEPRRPLPRLRGRSLVRGRRGHRVPRRPRRPAGRVHARCGRTTARRRSRWSPT